MNFVDEYLTKNCINPGGEKELSSSLVKKCLSNPVKCSKLNDIKKRKKSRKSRKSKKLKKKSKKSRKAKKYSE